MWHEVDLEELEREQYSLIPAIWTSDDVGALVVSERLRLYNHDLPCGAAVLRKRLHEHYNVRPLPSLWRIGEILRRHGLTHGRTGNYPLDQSPQDVATDSTAETRSATDRRQAAGANSANIHHQAQPVLKMRGSHAC